MKQNINELFIKINSISLSYLNQKREHMGHFESESLVFTKWMHTSFQEDSEVGNFLGRTYS